MGLEIGQLSLGLTGGVTRLGPNGAGGNMELLTEQELAMDGTFSSFSVPATKTHLQVIMALRSTRAMNDVDGLRMRFNAATGDEYHSVVARVNEGGTVSSPGSDGFDLDHAFIGEYMAATALAGIAAHIVMDIPFYRDTSWHKMWQGAMSYQVGTGAGEIQRQIFAGRWEVTTAITAIEFFSSTTSNFASGSRIQVWGF